MYWHLKGVLSSLAATNDPGPITLCTFINYHPVLDHVLVEQL